MYHQGIGWMQIISPAVTSAGAIVHYPCPSERTTYRSRSAEHLSVSFPCFRFLGPSSLFCFLIQSCFQINQTSLVCLMCTNSRVLLILHIVQSSLTIGSPFFILPCFASVSFLSDWGHGLNRATVCTMVYLSGFGARAAWLESLERMKYISLGLSCIYVFIFVPGV
ncbi:hypothetical protein BDV59DRAFT_172361 [Aspergillus ambiguus]|uniref:uncharacterized protein n=1 Tax=Aspergillus ambiguus TaxID=176160 RepID=UPI003CCCDFCF